MLIQIHYIWFMQEAGAEATMQASGNQEKQQILGWLMARNNIYLQ